MGAEPSPEPPATVVCADIDIVEAATDDEVMLSCSRTCGEAAKLGSEEELKKVTVAEAEDTLAEEEEAIELLLGAAELEGVRVELGAAVDEGVGDGEAEGLLEPLPEPAEPRAPSKMT